MVKNNKKPQKKKLIVRSAKEEKLFQNLKKALEEFMAGKKFSPLSESELIERLSIAPQYIPLFQEVLQELTQQRLVDIHLEKYSWISSQQEVVKGILRMHPRGFGFVQLDQPTEPPQDIFIPKHLTKNAVDGDHVEVIINQESISEKGPEGKIIAILSRGRTHMAGTIRQVDANGQCIAYVPLLGLQQRVIVEFPDEQPLHLGDRVIIEITDWGSKETGTYGRFSHYLGHISDPACDISAAIEEFGIRSDFPHQAVQEAESLGKQVSSKSIKEREDLRQLTTITIDPDTAKDYDDALSLTKTANGIYRLGVHIADVSYYVRPGTALDKEASLRCNSTYFPGSCIPMLPSALSENLCSLKAGVNRLTVSVLMEFDTEGNLIHHRIVRSVIKSAKRFTYREAKIVLDRKKSSPHADTLDLMVELCKLLKKKRYERGSIEFSLPELVVLIDEKGVPYQTDYISYDITHQMVEEFMLKANEMIAWDLTQKGKNLTYRVHDEPTEENLRDFSVLASSFGFKIADYPTPQDLQSLFEEANQTSYGNYLASCYIRRMRLAIYSPDNIGHYGLSLTHYCHFTSPIRRYVDLVVHRILFGESDDLSYLQEVALRCSEQERISAKAESSVLVLKKLRLLQTMYAKDPDKEYEAIITKVKNFGIYFEIIEILLEGFIHISDLADDYFIFEEERMCLRGKRSGTIYAPGNRLHISLTKINLIEQEAKWHPIACEQAPTQPKVKTFQKTRSKPSTQNRTSQKPVREIKGSKNRKKKYS
jgi:ribonuclease R